MNIRYAVVLEAGSILPDRDFLISQAWGDVPVSYVQDHEVFNECSYLDLKINKWEVNREWSNRPDSDAWIRIEILRAQNLEEYLRSDECSLPIDTECDALLTFELDEGGGVMDEMLLLRLLSVFYGQFKVYRCSDFIEEVSADTIASLPERSAILDKLTRCE
ncbi:hypothetical protein CER19_20020 [Pseudomonas sp. GL93]|uniref:hypothetical protein n=1 Tax=Pseudomonas sp. GL93 TaxID=2014741 RepID=UPI000E3161E0|nr:hypothetical protein [Pseudomonas sp. GL93]RFD26913.1 hypothetical protein CER19_20020 [Pseudomonas sp. GL93]